MIYRILKCFSTLGKESALWYPWGPSTSQCKLFLCKECWLYWKKYGGLKKTAKSTNPSPLAEAVYKCRICNKKFNRAERLSNHMAAHKGLKCTFPGCEKVTTLLILLAFRSASLRSCRFSSIQIFFAFLLLDSLA